MANARLPKIVATNSCAMRAASRTIGKEIWDAISGTSAAKEGNSSVWSVRNRFSARISSASTWKCATSRARRGCSPADPTSCKKKYKLVLPQLCPVYPARDYLHCLRSLFKLRCFCFVTLYQMWRLDESRRHVELVGRWLCERTF